MSVPLHQGPLLGLEDELVILHLRELVGEVENVELMDAIFCAVDEVLERVAPEAKGPFGLIE